MAEMINLCDFDSNPYRRPLREPIIRRRLNAAFNNFCGDGVTSKTRNVVDAQFLHEVLTILSHGFVLISSSEAICLLALPSAIN